MSLLSYKDFLNETFLYEAEMQTKDWSVEKDNGKYRKQFLEFLNDPRKELKIDPKFLKVYSFSSFTVNEIENISEIKKVKTQIKTRKV